MCSVNKAYQYKIISVLIQELFIRPLIVRKQHLKPAESCWPVKILFWSECGQMWSIAYWPVSQSVLGSFCVCAQMVTHASWNDFPGNLALFKTATEQLCPECVKSGMTSLLQCDPLCTFSLKRHESCFPKHSASYRMHAPGLKLTCGLWLLIGLASC